MLTIAEQVMGLQPHIAKTRACDDVPAERAKEVYEYIVRRAANVTSRDIQNDLGLTYHAASDALRILKREKKIIGWYTGRCHLYTVARPAKRRK